MAASHLGPKPYGIFGADVDTDISSECGYEIPLTKICKGGWVYTKLSNFIPNISALNSKHLDKLDKLHKYTILNDDYD